MPNPRRPDKFQNQARAEGYEARSVYKLQAIDDKLRVIPKKGGILDLGCAPGSWSRFAKERGGAAVKIVGIDLQPVRDYVGEAIEGSILDVPASRYLEMLGGRAKLVMSDMAPSTNGNRSSDHLRQIELVRMAFSVVQEVLAHDGTFVAKIFDGSDVPSLMAELRPWFKEIKRVRPEAVRQESREFFIACLGFKRPLEPVRVAIDAPESVS